MIYLLFFYIQKKQWTIAGNYLGFLTFCWLSLIDLKREIQLLHIVKIKVLAVSVVIQIIAYICTYFSFKLKVSYLPKFENMCDYILQQCLLRLVSTYLVENFSNGMFVCTYNYSFQVLLHTNLLIKISNKGTYIIKVKYLYNCILSL